MSADRAGASGNSTAETMRRVTARAEFRARYLVESFLTGRHRSPIKGTAPEFAEYRTYQVGDDLRRIDWRLYGRSDRLCVKQFEDENQLRACLALDSHPPSLVDVHLHRYRMFGVGGTFHGCATRHCVRIADLVDDIAERHRRGVIGDEQHRCDTAHQSDDRGEFHEESHLFISLRLKFEGPWG